MKEFPKQLSVKNKSKFKGLRYRRLLCYLRKELYEHMLVDNEDSYYALDTFYTANKVDIDSAEKMSITVMKELEKLGWKCKLSFGGTGLFIYSSADPPKSCW